MSKFMYVQIKKIDIDKWNEGIRLQRDPGPSFVLEWISKNAEWFRGAWNQSLCQNCQHWRNCGHLVRSRCDFYRQEQQEQMASDPVE